MPGTIDITIKTLDGNSRKFENISSELTVKEFKEKIASKVGIAAGQQRLISAGRVLNDESLLSSLNLDGQTIHLVERRPIPNQPPPASDTIPNRPRAPNQRPPRPDVPSWFGGPPMMQAPFRLQFNRRPPPGTPFQGPRNVGPRISTPMNLGRPATNPLEAGSNRVEHCRRFIDNAKHVLFHLKRLKTSILGTSSSDENPNVSTNDEASGSRAVSSEESNPAVGPAETVENNQETTENSQRPQAQGQAPGQNRQLPRAYPASEIIALHRSVRSCENELQEYVDLCEQLMSNESTELSRETRRLHEKLVHGIGEASHFLAHAQHSLSDLFTDFSQQPRLSLAVPTPMGQLTTASIGIRNIVPAPHGAIRIPVPVAPPQFVEPFVPPHQRPPTSDNQEGETVTNAPPNAENSNTAPTYTNSFPHNMNPINVQQFSHGYMQGNPTTVIRASFRPMVPTTATTTRPSPLQENGMNVRNDQSQANVPRPNPLPQQLPSQPGQNQSTPHQHFFDTRQRTIGPRDPFVPCSSRFFNSVPNTNRSNSSNRNAAATGPDSESTPAAAATASAESDNNGAIETRDEMNRPDQEVNVDENRVMMEQSLQEAMQNMMGGIPGISVELNSNVVSVDPSRPIGEQIQHIMNTAALPPGQIDQIAGQLEHIIQTSLPLGPGMEATNIFFSDVQVVPNHMDPVDDQYSEEHDVTNENSNAANDGATHAPHAAATNPMENLFGNILQGLFGQASNQDSPGQTPSLYDILRNNAAAVGLQDVQNSITTDITSCFCRSLSLANIFTLVNGDSSSLSASRPSFRRLIEETVLQGNEFSDSLMRTRTRFLVENDRALTTYSSDTAATNQNINLRETINNFITQRLCDLFGIGLNSEITDAQYCEQVHYSLTHSLHEFLVLINAVLQPSQDIGNFLITSGGLMGAFGVRGNDAQQQPGFNNLLNTVLEQQLRVLSRTASSHVRVSDVERFIVRTPSAVAEGSCGDSQSCPSEPMDMCDNPRTNSSSETSSAVRPKKIPQTATSAPVDSMLRDEPPLNLFSNVTSETFQEFFEHTLQNDAEKERQLTGEAQSFYSDAYLLGMPMRHRQAASSSGAIGFSNSVPNLLNRALSAPQFSSVSQNIREDMRSAVREDSQIGSLFADVLRQDFRERAERDPELRKRPSTRKFIDGST